MDNCTHNFKNPLTSSSHANFGLDIFHYKTLLYSFWGYENGLKAYKICKLLSHLNTCLHYIYIRLHILRMNTFILHQVAAQVLRTRSCGKVLSNCLIYQQAQLERPLFV